MNPDGIQLSVVIAAHNAEAVIEACLKAIEPQRHECGLEVIVVDSSTDRTPDLVARRFTWVRLTHVDRPLTVPELRGYGLADARGEVIAILDPYSVVSGDWVRRVLAAHRECANLVIGGSVDLYRPELRGLSAWAIYFNEYGLFMPPIAQGQTTLVPGSNVTYKRSALFIGPAPRYPVFWKTFVNWEIERSGSPLWLAADVGVRLNKPIPFGDFLRTRYHHGRCFAAMRASDAAYTERIGRAIASPLLPALLLWRWTRGFWPKRRHRPRFIATLPAQLALFSAWAWGEACGYLCGAGRSCEQLFY